MTNAPIAGKRVILVLLAGVLIYGLAMGTTYPLLGILLSERVTSANNGLNAAATGLGLLLGVVLVPSVSRLIGARRTVLLGILLMALALVALSQLRDFWALFAARALLGCGANLLFIVTETALNVFSSPAQRGRVMGIYAAVTAFGFVVGPSIVALAPGQPVELLLGCALVTVCALLPIAFASHSLDTSVQATPATRLLPSVIAFPFAFGFILVASAIDAVAISLLPVITLDQGYPVASGALFVAVFHIGLVVGQPIVGLALDWLGRRRTILLCCLLSLVCALVLVLARSLGFWPVALIMFVWGGANYGLYTAGLALIGDHFNGAALTAATAALAGVYAVASVGSPPLAGALVDSFGATGFYGAVATLYVLAAVAGAVFFRPAEPTLSPRAERV